MFLGTAARAASPWGIGFTVRTHGSARSGLLAAAHPRFGYEAGMLVWLLACDSLFLAGTLSLGEETGADPGAGSDPNPAGWCDEELDAATPAGPDCTTATLACGDVLTATTAGGFSSFTGEQYPANFCFTNLDRSTYGGPERIYLVELEAEQYAEVVLSASCARMGLSVIRWQTEGTCPSGEFTVPVCDGEEGTGSLAVTFGGYPSENRWVIVVDTAADDPAAFRLALTCAA